MIVQERHPLWVRWSHGLNAPLLFLMIWSGLLIYWANDVYRPFFPVWFYSFFGIEQRLAEGMAVHFLVMVPFALNGLVYVAYLAASGRWRTLAPGRGSFLGAIDVVLRDLKMRRGSHADTAGAYNDAQKLSYCGAIGLGALSLFSGLAIYKPMRVHWLATIFGGYEGARLIHFLAMLGLSAFVVVHVFQVLRAGFGTFRSIVAGFEIEGTDGR